jgi:hypothetical protein
MSSYKPALIPCKCKPKYAYVYAGVLFCVKIYFQYFNKKKGNLKLSSLELGPTTDFIKNIIQFLTTKKSPTR